MNDYISIEEMTQKTDNTIKQLKDLSIISGDAQFEKNDN